MPAFDQALLLTVWLHVQAAAHGVPTVATKNGGPVDIMTTLHHGLLVDPNSSKEIADALVKILTEPKEWEEMSQNGIKNIMAYSWPSHCKQVLESLEKEKRTHKTHTVRSRLSHVCFSKHVTRGAGPMCKRGILLQSVPRQAVLELLALCIARRQQESTSFACKAWRGDPHKKWLCAIDNSAPCTIISGCSVGSMSKQEQ